MEPRIEIRVAGPQDVAVVADLGARTARSTYAALPAAAVAAYVADAFAVECVEALLADRTAHVAVASIDGYDVGYTQVRAAQAPLGIGGVHPLLLERIYVVDEAHGLGVGRALHATVSSIAESNGHDLVWLTVWEHNSRAIEVYRRWGYSDRGSVSFGFGGQIHNDRVMTRWTSTIQSATAQAPHLRRVRPRRRRAVSP